MTPFCRWFRALLADRHMSTRRFSELALASKSTIARVHAGHAPPPLDCIERWGLLLELTPAERVRWRILAMSAHAPGDLRERLVELADQVAPLDSAQR